MNELIKITETEQGMVVSAREIYKFLELEKSQVSRWLNKNVVNNPYFQQGVDWVGFDTEVEGNKVKDYAISIDMSKKLSMASHSKKGNEVREYFIACEQIAKDAAKVVIIPSYQIENPIERAKAWIVEQEKVLLLEEKNEKLQFRSDFVDVCFETDGLFSMEEVCKILKLPYGRNSMMSKLRQLKVLLESNTPKQNLINNGYFKVVETLLDNGKFRKLVSTTYATQKGIGYIHKLLKA
jgi:anti-repressor protein